MECRTNDLFKGYLREQVITKTPSPEPQVFKFKEMLQKEEQSVINQSVSRLCSMMENCENQFKNSNNMLQSLFSADSDFIVLQKAELKSIFNEFHKEFSDFKSEMKSDMSYLKNHVVQQHQTTKPHSQNTLNSSRKPLTPPSSFEEILKARNLDSFTQHNDMQCGFPTIKQEKKQHCYASSPPKTINASFNKSFKSDLSPQLPLISYKLEKRATKKRKKPPKTRLKSPAESTRSSMTTNRMRKTQSWINSLPMVPPAETPISIKYKKVRRPDSDEESVASEWSCRSVRTVKSRKREDTVVLDIGREVRSEMDYHNVYSSPGSLGFRSEY